MVGFKKHNNVNQSEPNPHIDVVNKKLRANKKKLAKLQSTQEKLDQGKLLNQDQIQALSDKKQLEKGVKDLEDIVTELRSLSVQEKPGDTNQNIVRAIAELFICSKNQVDEPSLKDFRELFESNGNVAANVTLLATHLCKYIEQSDESINNTSISYKDVFAAVSRSMTTACQSADTKSNPKGKKATGTKEIKIECDVVSTKSDDISSNPNTSPENGVEETNATTKGKGPGKRNRKRVTNKGTTSTNDEPVPESADTTSTAMETEPVKDTPTEAPMNSDSNQPEPPKGGKSAKGHNRKPRIPKNNNHINHADIHNNNENKEETSPATTSMDNLPKKMNKPFNPSGRGGARGGRGGRGGAGRAFRGKAYGPTTSETVPSISHTSATETSSVANTEVNHSAPQMRGRGRGRGKAHGGGRGKAHQGSPKPEVVYNNTNQLNPISTPQSVPINA